jgi:hypothetical protein
VRERGTQRTDSTHVLAAVRDLTRLELITETVRAALEETAGTAPELLAGLVDVHWGHRYARPVRLGKNPTRPKTRIANAGDDAVQLLDHLHTHGTGHVFGPWVQALRQILMQNYYRDAAGRLRWRTDDDGGLPPSSRAIISPYDPTARYARRGQATRWKGFLAHLTETCLPEGASVITDVATTAATTNDTQALPGIHTRLNTALCYPPSTSSTVATPPWSTWNKLPENIKSPSPGRYPAIRLSSIAATRASTETISTSTSIATGHRQRVCPRPRHASVSLPGTTEGSPAACLHGDRREYRAPQRSTTERRTNPPRQPTAFQDCLDQQEITRLKSWRAVSI